ncbi:GNAT family N-acetyltransferase [Alteromonas pelagimontana]|uniref:GNAT family N-acetyltransferase n=1 Tax=Alteromonas pelagimontana TaxID=1858656 RepID=A0A6M4MIH5_9ALTE|nr:GNAT family N-acetyltransferase [Alteromonas pelagimontana]QJR82410.1 GNAT family N-acetyltransferase [Alteromonas pelagimontana]
MAFQVENVDWVSGKNRLTQLRERVFILEWRLPREAEFDERDANAFHILISNDKREPIATGRLTRDGEIGRIAVKQEHRDQAVYQKLFNALIGLAKIEQVPTVSVSCDLEGVEHHRQLGFKPSGPVFMEAGIPRQRMACSVNNFPLPDVTKMH